MKILGTIGQIVGKTVLITVVTYATYIACEAITGLHK